MKARAFPLVVPSGNAGGFVFILASMWYVGANQGNGAAYVLFFFLLSVLAVSIPHTFLNLIRLKVTADSAKPAFAGQEISLPIEVANLSRRVRRSVALSLPGMPDTAVVVDEIPSGKSARTRLHFPAVTRGEHEIGTILLESSYPLGFFSARKTVRISQRYLVYPKPEGDPALPDHSTGATRSTDYLPVEGDDFAGVRAYMPGESQRHIDWKAVARGLPLMSKQFLAEGGGILRLDYAAIPAGNTESRLSQLALWVIEAERARRHYSLRLPSVEIPASLGENHFHQCLRALALFR